AEKRVALAPRFSEAAQLVQAQSGADYLKERYWADCGVRYGSLEEVAADVVEELQGAELSVEQLVAKALGQQLEAPPRRSPEQLKKDLSSEDWHLRLQAVQELGTVEDALPALVEALKDANHQVRRLAAAALGASGAPAAVDPLSQALLNDPS